MALVVRLPDPLDAEARHALEALLEAAAGVSGYMANGEVLVDGIWDLRREVERCRYLGIVKGNA